MSATSGVCIARPHWGVIKLRSRNMIGSPPRSTMAHHRSLSRRQARSSDCGDRPAGHDGAPCDPAALFEEGAEVAGDAGQLLGHGDRQDVGTGRQQRGDVDGRCRSSARRRWPPTRSRPSPPTADRWRGRARWGSRVTSRRRTRARQAARSGVSRATPRRRRRRSRADGCGRPGPRRRTMSRRGPRPAVSATPSVTGPTNCHFTGPW